MNSHKNNYRNQVNRNDHHNTVNKGRARAGRKDNQNKKMYITILVVFAVLAVIFGLFIFARKKAVEVASEKVLEQIIAQQVDVDDLYGDADMSPDGAYSAGTGDGSASQGGNLSQGGSDSTVTGQQMTAEAKQALKDKKVKVVLEKIDKKDRKVVENIVSEHLNASFVVHAVEYLEAGNINGLRKMAEEELTQAEIDELMDIYNKYKDDFK